MTTSLLDFSQRRQDGPFLNLPLPGFLFLGWWFLAKSDLFFCLFSFFFLRQTESRAITAPRRFTSPPARPRRPSKGMFVGLSREHRMCTSPIPQGACVFLCKAFGAIEGSPSSSFHPQQEAEPRRLGEAVKGGLR